MYFLTNKTLPIFFELSNTELLKSLSKKKSFLANFKSFAKLLFQYFLPKIIAFFLDFTIAKYLSTKFIFVRSDLTHFGSWMQLFMTANYFDMNNDSRKIVALGIRNTIDRSLVSHFFNGHIVIYNPFLHIILSGFFFSKYLGYDVNGSIIKTYNKSKNCVNYESIPVFSEKFIESVSILNNQNKSYSSKEIESQFFSNYFLFYPRTGNWQFSYRDSKRNMPLNLRNSLIQEILKYSNIVVLGESEIYDRSKKQSKYKCIHINEFIDKGISIPNIYRYSSGIIGSVSGATHFPSFLFNKPTLYLTEIPLNHLDLLYLCPQKIDKIHSSDKFFRIPYKDKWFIFPQQKMEIEFTNFIPRIIKEFIYNKKITSPSNFSSNFYQLPITDYYKRTLVPSNEGNIFIYNPNK